MDKDESDYHEVSLNEKIRSNPSKRSRWSLYNFKNFIISGTLLVLLIWGTSFLLVAIENFKIPQITNARIQQYLKANGDSSSSLPKYTFKPFDVSDSNKFALNFTAVRDGKFRPNFKSLQWITEPSSIFDDKGTYLLQDEIDGETKYLIRSIIDEDYQISLFNGSVFNHHGINYTIDNLNSSPDLTKAILRTNTTHNWRHSTFALYWLLDIKGGGSIVPIMDTTQKLAVTSWSPDSNHLAYILENNVYIKNIISDEVTQVTTDGSIQVFNGKPDWVYEEEVFGDDIVLWWSPNGDKFTFLKSNDTEVPEFTIPYYVQEGHDDYPEVIKIKYPKAGYPNPIVDLVIYDLKSNKQEVLQLESDNITPDNRLITEVVWVGGSVLVKTSNRASDLLEIFLVDSESNSYKLIRTLTAEKSWFEITSNTFFVPKNESLGINEDGYIDTVVDGGYNHLAYFSPPNNPNGRLLTKGQWEVLGGVKSFDYTTNEVYFISTLKSSVERHIYSVNLFDATKDLENLPVIKSLTTGEGWYSGSFSSGSRYLLLTYAGPEVPYQKLTDLKSSQDIKTIESNQQIIDNLEDYIVPKVEYKVITLTDKDSGEEFKVNAVETYPLNFDENYEYPVLFFVYGGPGSQTVTKTFDISFSAVVAAELNAVVVTVDGRGTGFNNHNADLGSDFKFIVRDRLGQFEPKDQIAAAKLYAKKSYVDASRIAIWGWSYGGFLTLKTLETDYEDSIFSYGVSIAPVTKWKFYDSIYTERYLRTPQENPEGYQIASIHNVTNFQHVKKFFIGHGSGDDNVHVQNTLKLIDDFNVGDIENFEFMIFPDSDHSIRYHNGNKIVYDRILNFLKRAFSGEFI
ncbi:dipeptidyl aminopeptidase B [Scheffersomyces coipomensis]|uniref:dipeptidyl aminopeptidase B n=1 Tax=Scheffersomyces coipomensis TaxID=1788519 RepID=UPI00315CD38E